MMKLLGKMYVLLGPINLMWLIATTANVFLHRAILVPIAIGTLSIIFGIGIAVREKNKLPTLIDSIIATICLAINGGVLAFQMDWSIPLLDFLIWITYLLIGMTNIGLAIGVFVNSLWKYPK